MVKPSAGGGIAGFIADRLLGTFPLGTLAGTFHKALFNLSGADMDRAYDPARATRGTRTHDFGDLKGMASGLFGDIKAAFEQRLGAGRTGTGPAPQDRDDATAMARPQVTQETRQQAQAQSGLGGWGKALLYGGLALGGLTLLREFSIAGAFGVPFYGGMAPWATHPMVHPMMAPTLFW